VHGIVTLSILSLFLFITACEDEPVAPPQREEYIDLFKIISNPLAPAPGELVTLTAQAVGYSGGWPGYYWEVEAGSLITDQGISVQWRAPNETRVVRVAVRASTSQNADEETTDILVRHWEALASSRRLNFAPKEHSSILYFIGEGGSYLPTSDNFAGYHVYRSSGDRPISQCNPPAATCVDGGYDFQFLFPSNTVVGSMVQQFSSYFRQQWRNVFSFPTLGFGTAVNITNDFGPSDPLARRKNQHVTPFATDDMSMIVWQAVMVGEADDGTEDLFNIRFKSNPAQPNPPEMELTRSVDSVRVQIGPDIVTIYRYYKNFSPMISPDGQTIVYFVGNGSMGDTTVVPEPCLIPIVGGIPDTTQREGLVDENGVGIFSEAGISIRESTYFEWNPVNNILAFIDSRKHLCYFDYSTRTATNLSEAGVVEEFAWAPDGARLAVVTEEGISLVSVSGAITHNVFEREVSSDDIRGINWSPDPDDAKLGFRMVRKGRTSADSYSALVILSETAQTGYYASPRVPWTVQNEFDVKFTWWRVYFEDDNESLYAPMPVAGIAGKNVVIYHSYVDSE